MKSESKTHPWKSVPQGHRTQSMHSVLLSLPGCLLRSPQSSGLQERGLVMSPLAPDPLSDPESSSPQFHFPAYKIIKSLVNSSLLGDSVQSFPGCYQYECSPSPISLLGSTVLQRLMHPYSVPLGYNMPRNVPISLTGLGHWGAGVQYPT